MVWDRFESVREGDGKDMADEYTEGIDVSSNQDQVDWAAVKNQRGNSRTFISTSVLAPASIVRRNTRLMPPLEHCFRSFLPPPAITAQWEFWGRLRPISVRTPTPTATGSSGVYERPLITPSSSPLQGVLFTWLFAGTEFERQANNSNFISSPLLDFPLRLRGAIHQQNQVIPVLTPEIGMEIGNNFENAVHSGGQGAIARGIIGGNFSITFNPKLKLLQGIHLTSGYKLRLPATDEVFTLSKTNTNGKSVDVPSLNTKPRHYIKNEVGFTLWDPISFTITHEYGEIPPAFRLVDHKVVIGLTLAVQQTNKISAALTSK